MTDAAKRLVKALREDAEWAHDHEWDTPITLGDNLESAANRIEKLSADRDAWQRRAEAAERDIRDMLVRGNVAICHFCKQDTNPDCLESCEECGCAYVAEWRGPCAENGGISNGHQTDFV